MQGQYAPLLTSNYLSNGPSQTINYKAFNRRVKRYVYRCNYVQCGQANSSEKLWQHRKIFPTRIKSCEMRNWQTFVMQLFLKYSKMFDIFLFVYIQSNYIQDVSVVRADFCWEMCTMYEFKSKYVFVVAVCIQFLPHWLLNS